MNLDAKILGDSYLAKDRPDLVEKNITDLEHYYKEDVQRDQFLAGNLQHKEIVCDMFCDIRYLPFDVRTVSEILAVQVVEHFSFMEVEPLLRHWVAILQPGGKLHIDVPELIGTIDTCKTDIDWGLRLLYGSQKNEYGYHKCAFTPVTLRKLFEKIGLIDITEMPNMHTYPAFGMTGIKI